MLNDIKIYLYTPPTDMRKSIDTLCMMISETLQMDPANGHLFIFRNRMCIPVGTNAYSSMKSNTYSGVNRTMIPVLLER